MTADVMEKLKDRGWYITEHGYNVGSNSRNIHDVEDIVRRLKDIDLREIGSGQGDIAQGNIVLQIQKIRNVSAPKNNEESRAAPRMLKLSLTDGKNNFQAIEIDHISALSLNTPPGTKILIKSGQVPMSHGMILMVKGSEMVHVLGGSVSNLVEKWELNKKLALHTRVRPAEDGGPPPWIPFGKKIIKVLEHDKNFKALAEKDKSSKENAVFEAQRKDAIAEATKQGSKKVFGGGSKQLLDHSVQKIIDQGFSKEQAEYALNVNKNNVDRALKSLIKVARGSDTKKVDKHGAGKESREPRGKRSEKKSEESKPSSGKIFLFDFLEELIPNASPSNHAQNAENVYDKVDSKNSDTLSDKRGRSQRGARRYQAPPRHQEENKNSKRTNSSQYTQYNGNNSSQQSKPPRFQRNQEPHSNYQQDGGGKTYQKSQSVEYRSSTSQPRAEGNVNEGTHSQKVQDQQGKNFNASKTYNQGDETYRWHKRPQQVETYNNQYSPRSWRIFDKCLAKYWKDGNFYSAEVVEVFEQTCTVQFDQFKDYREVLLSDCIPLTAEDQALQDNADSGSKSYRSDPPNSNNKNSKSQMNRYPSNDNSGPRGALGSKGQRNETQYGNNQCANPAQAENPRCWQIFDKCLAKYWKDGNYYSAEVTDVFDQTCTVRFDQFKDYRKVLLTDCLPLTAEDDTPQDNVDPRSKTYRSDPPNTNNKSNKNQINRYQPNDNSGPRGALGPKSQRNETQYGNNQCANPIQAGNPRCWRAFDECLAKYWRDGNYYSAEVIEVFEQTCTVRFDQFNDYHEVLLTDCIPISAEDQSSHDNVDPRRSDQPRYNNRQQPYYDQGYNHISGMEFRRSGSGPPAANRGYGRRRGQKRSSQPIYQPPAQRSHNSTPMNTQNNSLL